MRALAVGKFLLVAALVSAWSSLATAQNTAPVRGQMGIGVGSSASSTTGRSPTRAAGQFHALCLTYRGPTCGLTSRTPFLADEMCHCGPNPGSTLSTDR
jgi:hypothetical protein